MLTPENPSPDYLEQLMADEQGVVVAVSDFIKSMPNGIARWLPGTFIALGTDGFGLSEAP